MFAWLQEYLFSRTTFVCVFGHKTRFRIKDRQRLVVVCKCGDAAVFKRRGMDKIIIDHPSVTVPPSQSVFHTHVTEGPLGDMSAAKAAAREIEEDYSQRMGKPH